MKATLWSAAILLILVKPVPAEFVGTLELKPAGCQATGKCELVYDFGYIDPSGLGWQAKAGLMTDGASIPSWAQGFVGTAWDKQFIRAAVIHDWYCIRTVRTRRLTHRMFYDSLVESGVDRAKALAMYYAVIVGSHMWISLIEGQPCGGMPNCVQSVGGSMQISNAGVNKNENASASIQISNTVIRKSESGELVAYRAPRFDSPDIATDIADAGNIIVGGSVDSPDKVEALARRRHPNDFFLRNGDAIVYHGPSSRYPDR